MSRLWPLNVYFSSPPASFSTYRSSSSLSPDVRPTEDKPIVRLSREGERKCVLARWGLVPYWAKDVKFGNRCINARAETLATTPAFREAYARRHCLVPLNAFYEWSEPKGQRIQWRIRLKDEPLFALAGLWEWWRDAKTQNRAPSAAQE